MTKVVVNAGCPAADIFRKALAVLPRPAITAYRESKGVIYLVDNRADAAVSSLRECGIPVEVVRNRRTTRPYLT